MQHKPFRVDQIDHVELFVPDQYEAAEWYQRILGLQILPEHEHWAATGPLMISSNGGGTMLALFKGKPRVNRETAGHHRVAFRVSGPGFLDFLDHVDANPIDNGEGQRITRANVIDHDQAYSIYFCDPYGNRYEVTTYDYDQVIAAL